MLRCTAAAARTIEDRRKALGVSETSGLRVFDVPNPNGQTGIRMTFVDEPIEGDVVVEAHGERIFIARGATAQLDGRELDAAPEVAPAGLILRP